MTERSFAGFRRYCADSYSAAIVIILIGGMAAHAPPACAQQPRSKAGAQSGPEAKDADAKDTRLTLEDVRRLRGKHTSAGQVADMVAEQGRAFEVTEESEREVRKLGFSTAQVAAIKDASPDPLVPGKWLSSNDAERDASMEAMRHVAAKSGVAIEPASTRHVTLWAAKGIQKTYLADLQKAEKFFHTKCAEPIRSGLDKRAAHVVLLNNRAEYTAWWRAMLELDNKTFEVKDNPGFGAQIRQQVFKSLQVYTIAFCVICTGAIDSRSVRQTVAFSVGYQCAGQLTDRSNGVLQTGFGHWTETAVCGSPAFVGGNAAYGQELPHSFDHSEDWGLLVKQRLRTGKVTPLTDLLKADQITFSQPVHAEMWLLVGLLNQQPAKFGKLLLALKDGDSDLAAIEKVYGWNEKELDKQWRAYVLKPGKKKPAGSRD
jgi:hypothetical protein